MFSRILSINIVSMLACIVVLGSMQMVLLTNYITKQSEDYLSKNAETIVKLISGNMPVDTLNGIVNGFSGVTGSYILVMDKNGRVMSGTANSSLTYDGTPLYIDKEYTRTVLSGQKNVMIGTMGRLFRETMFTLQIPVMSSDGEAVVGAVSVSRPIPEHQKIKYDMFRTLFTLMIFVAATVFALSYILAKRFSVPMHNMSETTREFAKGNFAARTDESAVNSNIYEIAELAEAFNVMAADLEKAEEIKNSFISDVSHELRTPMTTIKGFVGGILDDTIPEDKQKEYLKIVYDEISRLSRLVNTFLDITRLQSDKMTLNKINFDINEVIRLCIIKLDNKIEKRAINVELNFETESCFVFADKDSITRVLTNLLDNAAKFTDEGGKITVSVGFLQHDVTVSVKNSGCGISEENQAMIFNRFYKADKSRSENKEGTGIGLYLVKNILRAHGKDISVSSVEGEYAEFMFRLERGKAPSQLRVKLREDGQNKD